MIIISDNSALSCLAELGELDLLRKLYGTVVITASVRREACHDSAPEALRRFIAAPQSWPRQTRLVCRKIDFGG